MDEQRVQAYYQLIQQLLTCASGEEGNILEANRELIDAGLVQMMEAVAQKIAEAGEANGAAFLRNLAQTLRTGEQRLPAYRQLIEQLLTCTSGQEADILEANRELVDAGLVQVMEAEAERMAEAGEANGAEFLHNLAGTLAKGQQYGFLMQVLQTSAESQGNAEAVYALLRENLDKLDDSFGELLQEWATATLAELDPQQAQVIAAIIGDFSSLIKDFPLGSRASNLEIAITGYEMVAEVLTRDGSPEVWATLQNHLGNAYSARVRGERADNLERAIAAYSQALQVYTRDTFPLNYISTQYHLGLAFQEMQRLQDAYRAFATAIETVEFLQGEAVLGAGVSEDKQKLYQRVVAICLAL